MLKPQKSSVSTHSKGYKTSVGFICKAGTNMRQRVLLFERFQPRKNAKPVTAGLTVRRMSELACEECTSGLLMLFGG